MNKLKIILLINENFVKICPENFLRGREEGANQDFAPSTREARTAAAILTS